MKMISVVILKRRYGGTLLDSMRRFRSTETVMNAWIKDLTRPRTNRKPDIAGFFRYGALPEPFLAVQHIRRYTYR